MNIQNVFSLFQSRAVRRWFDFFCSREAAPRPEGKQPEAAPGRSAPLPVPAAIGRGKLPADAATAVIPLPDPEIEALRLEVAGLKGRIADLSARRLEMEQLMERFEYSQYQALGERLAENLCLRHEFLSLQASRSGRAEDQEAERQAAEELEAYRRVREEGSRAVPDLAGEDLDELKRLYRAVAMRCHPDRVADADKAAAHDLFLRTQAAYRQNHLDGLRLIHRQLEEDSSWDGDSPADDRGRLQELLSDLQGQAADLILAIQTMQLDDVYRKAKRIDHWEDYFASIRELLDAESCSLKRKIRGFPKD